MEARLTGLRSAVKSGNEASRLELVVYLFEPAFQFTTTVRGGEDVRGGLAQNAIMIYHAATPSDQALSVILSSPR